MEHEAEIETLNKHALEILSHYEALNIAGKKVQTPYYTNNVGNFFRQLMEKNEVPKELAKKVHESYKNKDVPFGWYRGKGTPEQIESAVMAIAKKVDVSLDNAKPEGITEFMKLYGLGVDCSGFVYTTLNYSFSKAGLSLNENLTWADPEKQHVNYAGASVFYNSSKKVDFNNIRPLDLVLKMKDFSLKVEVDHVAVILKRNAELIVAESTLSSVPAGIHTFKVQVTDKNPKFIRSYTLGKTWEEYYEDGELVFKRLNVLQ